MSRGYSTGHDDGKDDAENCKPYDESKWVPAQDGWERDYDRGYRAGYKSVAASETVPVLKDRNAKLVAALEHTKKWLARGISPDRQVELKEATELYNVVCAAIREALEGS